MTPFPNISFEKNEKRTNVNIISVGFYVAVLQERAMREASDDGTAID